MYGSARGIAVIPIT